MAKVKKTTDAPGFEAWWATTDCPEYAKPDARQAWIAGAASLRSRAIDAIRHHVNGTGPIREQLAEVVAALPVEGRA